MCRLAVQRSRVENFFAAFLHITGKIVLTGLL